jgi:hypothetical protein
MILLDDATPKPDGIFGKDRGAGDGGSIAVVGSHDRSAPATSGSEQGPAGRMIARRIQEQAFGGLDRESLAFLEVWRTTAA